MLLSCHWSSVRQWQPEGRDLGRMGSKWRVVHGGISFPTFYFLLPVLFLLCRRSRDRLTLCGAKTGLCCVVVAGSTVDHSAVIHLYGQRVDNGCQKCHLPTARPPTTLPPATRGTPPP